MARVSRELSRHVLVDSSSTAPQVTLCETCLHVAMGLWCKAESAALAGARIKEICVPESTRFILEYSPHFSFGTRQLVVEFGFKTLRLEQATISHTRTRDIASLCGREISFDEFRSTVLEFCSRAPCRGVSTLHPSLDTREVCEGYAARTAEEHGVAAAVGNVTSLKFGNGHFLAACIDDTSTPRCWKVFSEHCLLLTDTDQNAPCSACGAALRRAKDSLGRLGSRQREIRRDPGSHFSTRRWGDGLIHKLFMSELQAALGHLYAQSEYRDEKVSFVPSQGRQRRAAATVSESEPVSDADCQPRTRCVFRKVAGL